MTAQKRLRCAIYTRKSTDEGLEQEFNSLDAQREACEAYIKSQAHQGWRLNPEAYDDGGHSGGTLERPAMQRLLDDVRSRRVDVIVVYKIDRLTRSLADFARLAELFDGHKVSFVSVTQQFNTTTSMGRLMLNVLLSFAQFERELTGERIRDKMAASKKKGMWMGGNVPLGYEPNGRTLTINESEAQTVRTLFQIYLEKGNVRAVKAEVDRLGLKTKFRIFPDGRQMGGRPFTRGHIYRILRSPIYVGEINYKKQVYPGLHEPIIDRKTWNTVQAALDANVNGERLKRSSGFGNLLAGLLFDAQGSRFTTNHAMKGGRRYRYYVSSALGGSRGARAKVQRIPAHEIETVVRDALLGVLDTPNQLMETLGGDLTAAEADAAIRAASSLGRLIQAEPASSAEHLRSLLHKVLLDTDTVRIQITRDNLRATVGLPDKGESGDLIHDLVVPTRIHLRGAKMKLVIHSDDEPTKREPDPTLTKTIAQARRWLELLTSGRVSSIREITKLDKVTRSYVTRVIRLACLAPSITEQILDCRHPIEVTAQRLRLEKDLPLGWPDQRRHLGFD